MCEKNIKGGEDRIVQEQSLDIPLSWFQVKVNCCKFRALCVIPIVTTKKISKKYT